MVAYEVTDKVFIVTGGATGLGALMVRSFLKEGARYIAFLDIAQDAGLALESELNTKHGEGKVKFIKCDVTDEDGLLSAYDEVAKAAGYVDVVINNAGIMNDSKKLYKKEIAINVTALVTGTLKAVELMRKDKGGRGGTVINISSIAGLVQSPILPIYFATKSAVLQFSNCIGMEPHHSRTGVRVIAMCFGATDTPLLSPEKIGGCDDVSDAELPERTKQFYWQRPESAVAGVVEAFKKGASASTWLAANDKPVIDITDNVKEAYNVLSRGVFP
ncbi:15-hydroxyprostaglandin dehydrogenase [Eumeta japonica]|uniref:15-hydroxyprostaglandin dehydrogenase n=1 Tax=Eumeta variegata TaxID=151549 RepID=A0A4C1UZ17_EUMVA|nr:15-hydroxyprostaglandin dehydrogenase [Eumeta japonica]